jgi:hypothetical protein
MAKRGRPRKDSLQLPLLQQKEIAIAKHLSGELLTLDETALAIWDPKTEARPMTRMGMLKFEKRILEKIRKALLKYGIHDLSDVFEPRRMPVLDKRLENF